MWIRARVTTPNAGMAEGTPWQMLMRCKMPYRHIDADSMRIHRDRLAERAAEHVQTGMPRIFPARSQSVMPMSLVNL
jgi:hypothetical protein